MRALNVPAPGEQPQLSASFVVRIEEGTARGDVYTDSHDLARLIRREPTPRRRS